MWALTYRGGISSMSFSVHFGYRLPVFSPIGVYPCHIVCINSTFLVISVSFYDDAYTFIPCRYLRVCTQSVSRNSMYLPSICLHRPFLAHSCLRRYICFCEILPHMFIFAPSSSGLSVRGTSFPGLIKL